jgi:hypothetical protein
VPAFCRDAFTDLKNGHGGDIPLMLQKEIFENRDPQGNETKHGGDSPLIFIKERYEPLKGLLAMTSSPCPRERS